jgi:hypothetical protein
MSNGLYTPNCIRTYSGIYIDVVNIIPEQVFPIDIAYHLARECRFLNSTKKFWSIVDHSVWCFKKAQELYPDDAALHFRVFMHDAHEYLTKDMATPYVESINNKFPGFKDIINAVKQIIQSAINTRFGISVCPLACDKTRMIDKMALEWEYENKMISWTGLQPIHVDANAEYWLDHFKKLVSVPVVINP